MPRRTEWTVLAVTILSIGCADPAPERGERQRLRAHFAAVDAELNSADVSHLSPAQLTARAGYIATLRRYRDRGEFPHNHDHADPTPYFVDQHGTHCALAFLIAESGRDDLVASIATTRNTARVAELADDPRLLEWLDGAGLSVAEAARIQPFYECPRYPNCPDPNPVDEDYVFAGGISLAASGFAVGMNLPSDSPSWRGWMALGAGAAGVYIGALEVDNDGTMGTAAQITLGAGVVAAAMGVRTLVTGHDNDDDASPPSSVVLAPAVTPDSAGLAIAGTF